MRFLLRILLLATAVALATVVTSWWAPCLVGGIWGWLARGGRANGAPHPAATAGVAGAAGWLGLLGWNAATGEMAALAGTLSGLLPVPGWMLAGITVFVGGLLALLASWLGRATALALSPRLPYDSPSPQ